MSACLFEINTHVCQARPSIILSTPLTRKTHRPANPLDRVSTFHATFVNLHRVEMLRRGTVNPGGGVICARVSTRVGPSIVVCVCFSVQSSVARTQRVAIGRLSFGRCVRVRVFPQQPKDPFKSTWPVCMTCYRCLLLRSILYMTSS